MGNFISFEIISINFFISLGNSGNNNGFLAEWLLLIALGLFLVLTIGTCIFYAKHRFSIRRHPRAQWFLPPTLMVIIIFLLNFFGQTNSALNSFKISKKKNPFTHRSKFSARRISGSFMKYSAATLSTAATYFGLEVLADFFQSEPEISAVILSSILTAVFLLLIFLIKIFKLIYQRFFPSNRNDQTQPIELTEIQTNIAELLNRSEPPAHTRH